MKAADGELRNYFLLEKHTNISLVLRMLQLMCEGHHSILQNYLRSQPDNIRSVDLVKVLLNLLCHY